jgi:aspartate carbamoyltransferase regulatory subunit
MDERAIFDERQETKQASFSCSYCGQRDMYDVRWLKRTKKKLNPKNMNERDRAQFDKSRDYMIRIDDTLNCKNNRCRKRFEIPTSQSVVFI